MSTTIPPRPVLLVEDNPDDELLALRALKKHAFANRIDVARDGAEALDYFFAEGGAAELGESELPCVVLLDLRLPKIDGLEVLKRLRADDRTKHMPVVILTSSDGDQDMVESYDRGANSFVQKPVNFVEFAEAVGRVGLYWVVTNKAAAT